MTANVISKSATIGETVEFKLGGWSLAINLAFLLYSAYSIAFPNQWLIVFHWPPTSALISTIFLADILRNSSWSPFYRGPTLTLTAVGISGRGGRLRERWSVTWNEFDHASWGRGFYPAAGGLNVYRKGLKEWQNPYCQYGPFNASGRMLIRCINERQKAYIESQKSKDVS